LDICNETCAKKSLYVWLPFHTMHMSQSPPMHHPQKLKLILGKLHEPQPHFNFFGALIYVVGVVLVWVCSPKGGREGVPQGVSLRVFPKPQENAQVVESPHSPFLHKQLFFYFLASLPFENNKNSMGMWEHIKLGGGLSQHNRLGFFCWGRSLKIHIETRGVSHCGLVIYIKRCLKAKEELWKLKYFTMQKCNLRRIL